MKILQTPYTLFFKYLYRPIVNAIVQIMYNLFHKKLEKTI